MRRLLARSRAMAQSRILEGQFRMNPIDHTNTQGLAANAAPPHSVRRVLLLGATGRTGRHVLHHALLRGLEVVALVRSPDRVTTQSSQLKVIMGSPLNPVDVAEAIAGCDAVVSTLNSVRTSDRPWSRPLSPPLLLTHCIGNCINEMRKRDIRRVVVMSAIGVGNTLAQAPLVLRWLIRHTNLKRMYADQNVQEQLLSQSGTRLDQRTHSEPC